MTIRQALPEKTNYRRDYQHLSDEDLYNPLLMTDGDSLGEILKEMFERGASHIQKLIPDMITYLRSFRKYAGKTNDLIVLQTIPSFLGNEQKQILNKFISKNIKADIMKGNFIEAWFFMKNWLGLTDLGTQNMYLTLLFQPDVLLSDELTEGVNAKDMEKNYQIMSNVVKPYFQRLQKGMIGRIISESTYNALLVNGIKRNDAPDKILDILNTLNAFDQSPKCSYMSEISDHIKRNRIEYKERGMQENYTPLVVKKQKDGVKDRQTMQKVEDLSKLYAKL